MGIDGYRVTCHCDNQAVVTAIYSHLSHQSHLLAASAKYNRSHNGNVCTTTPYLTIFYVHVHMYLSTYVHAPTYNVFFPAVIWLMLKSAHTTKMTGLTLPLLLMHGMCYYYGTHTSIQLLASERDTIRGLQI